MLLPLAVKIHKIHGQGHLLLAPGQRKEFKDSELEKRQLSDFLLSFPKQGEPHHQCERFFKEASPTAFRAAGGASLKRELS